MQDIDTCHFAPLLCFHSFLRSLLDLIELTLRSPESQSDFQLEHVRVTDLIYHLGHYGIIIFIGA